MSLEKLQQFIKESSDEALKTTLGSFAESIEAEIKNSNLDEVKKLRASNASFREVAGLPTDGTPEQFASKYNELTSKLEKAQKEGVSKDDVMKALSDEVKGIKDQLAQKEADIKRSTVESKITKALGDSKIKSGKLEQAKILALAGFDVDNSDENAFSERAKQIATNNPEWVDSEYNDNGTGSKKNANTGTAGYAEAVAKGGAEERRAIEQKLQAKGLT